ncbi:hypothetical protein EG329_005384 [Mollisiaceae sp. DMI_Dod_QoI]|nr:hypothetical protein EG329_005384 [Helotiales sp. DMI_Dod_QoI]
MPTVATPIFCCGGAAPVLTSSSQKLHYDPNRELHETIFKSFIAFAIRRQQEAERQEKARIQAQELLQLLMGALNPDTAPPTPEIFASTPSSFFPTQGSSSPASASRLAAIPASSQPCLATALAPARPQTPPAPVLTYEALKNNPLSPQIPYVIHLTSRHDFGPVYSHRYFVCPDDLSQDWIEVSLVQWFAQGEPFKMKAEKWDLKCTHDCRFFRMTLRPNLWLRGRYTVPVPTQTTKQIAYPVAEAPIQMLQTSKYIPYPMTNAGLESGGRALNVVTEPAETRQLSYYPAEGSSDGDGK